MKWSVYWLILVVNWTTYRINQNLSDKALLCEILLTELCLGDLRDTTTLIKDNCRVVYTFRGLVSDHHDRKRTSMALELYILIIRQQTERLNLG